MRKKYLIPLSIVLAVLAGGCAKEVNQEPFERYSYVEDEEKTEWKVEAGGASLTLDPATTRLIYKDKNGNEWASTPENPEDLNSYKGYDKEWAQSNLVLEYSNDVGNTKIYGSYKYSVEKGLYSIEQIDGETPGFDIHYTIGNIKREYKFPDILTDEEYEAWKEKFDAIDKKLFKKYIRESYDEYDFDDLPKEYDKEKLLESNPSLKGQTVHVLMGTIQEHLKAKIEELFAEAGYTEDDYAAYREMIGAKEVERSAEFNVTLQVRLVDGDLQATVPMDELEYYIGFYPIHLDILPYLGAASTKEDGYMIVPDGSGAVINFNNQKTDQSPYNSLVYGWDDAKTRKVVVDDSVSPYGVFSIVYNEVEEVKATEETEGKEGQAKKALLGIVTDGKSFSTIEADISGRNGNGGYNNAFASFDMIHYADMDVTGRSEHTVRVFEDQVKDGQKLQVLYRGVDTDSYVEVAASYRDYLMDAYGLKKLDGDHVPVLIETVGAVDVVDQVAGIPTTITLPLTTYKEAGEIVKDLKDSGLDFDVKYSGWMNGGVSNKNAAKVKTASGLGSAGSLKTMISDANSQGVDVYLDGYFQYIHRDKLIDSYSAKRDSSRYIGREVIKRYPFSPIWFGEDKEEDTKLTYLAKPDYWLKSATNYGKTIEKYGATGISYEDLGYKLSSDFNDKKPVTREVALSMQTDLFREMKDSGKKIMTKGGNDYTLPYADLITDVWTYAKLYNIEDYSIPFYEIAIHGLKEYTGSSLNISDDYEKSMLYCIETGAGLNYTVMNAEVSELKDSTYTGYYGTNYDAWKDIIVADVKKIESDLGSTADQFIVDHKILAEGVTQTEYENGMKVIVNYSFLDYESDGIKVGARDYIVIGGGK